ncbi:Mth938-like domain-containing protein [Sphingomonas sp. KR1UV-12]|uniref:Mth938-like domain-containing protein n=1 Tax=Sphingomonas aurea TaxID=3063994 RepID=A0ABT9EJT3_9SPHN|nr:Mth938-like domain-containing protein [Sphingomonas sp. KR1UV-12]MDP1027227.1 Mth938-like domain-containing protein [Sphingomonas sp. KR1UV-12]
MRMQRGQPVDGPLIRGFAGNAFRLDDVTVAPALLLTISQALDWTPPPVTALTVEALEPALTPTPEFILIGTGATLVRPPQSLVRALDARGIGLEAMDSRAAARAWGVLRDEGRQVAAALYPLDA